MNRQHQATPFIAPIALLAGATGARTMTGVSAAIGVRASAIAKVAAALALLELLCDKIPGIPNRTDLAPIVGRVAAGAFIGASVAKLAGRDRLTGAIIGSLFAFAGAQLTFRARRALTRVMPAMAAAAVEDAAIVAVARLGARALPSR